MEEVLNALVGRVGGGSVVGEARDGQFVSIQVIKR